MQDQIAPLSASVITTFPDHCFEVYGKRMIEGFTANMPMETPLLVMLDAPNLAPVVEKMLRPQDAVAIHNSKEREDFLERNKGKDDPNDYRKMASRFCHKVFAIKQASDFWKVSIGQKCRYLIWLDADVLVTRPVSVNELRLCMPKEGDAVAYLGRKDWDHSECGWMVFDFQNGGHEVIDEITRRYISDEVFKEPQWHDSYIWDRVMEGRKVTNLTLDKPGSEIWPQSPMAAWSRHYKGPIAKNELIGVKSQPRQGGITIQTKNSRPNDEIQGNIAANQKLITKWARKCKPTDEEIVIVSAGPTMVPEYLQDEINAGRKIVAVKHALQPLKAAGVKPWACILLDPREHVNDFVQNPDTDVIWFVASQVSPKVTETLLAAGCTVWGYHASVGAGEEHLTSLQASSIVNGGSATATRGMFLLEMLGFRNFRLYGYDLCLPDKPNLDEKDEFGQPKYFEVSLDAKMTHFVDKRAFWTKAELLAQYQEFNHILSTKDWKIRAFGHGIAEFIAEAKRISDLREEAKTFKLGCPKPVSYTELLKWQNKTPLWVLLPKWLLKRRRKQKSASSF